MSLAQHVTFGTSDQIWLSMPPCTAQRRSRTAAKDTRDHVRQLLDDGYVVFPIPHGSKQAVVTDWSEPDKRWKVDHFHPDDNLALRLDGIVDLDLDTREARRAAQAGFALSTGLMWGRPSNGIPSHYDYSAPGVTSEQFKDTDGTMLLELRTGSGQYSIVPPSHVFATDDKPAETITWMPRYGQPGNWHADAVRQSAVLIAITALLARHWPERGSRHDAAGAAAGFLARRGFDPPVVERIIETAADIAGDPEVEDRVAYAVATCGNVSAGARVSGGPTLAGIIGRDVVQRMRSWLVSSELEQRIEELNDRFAIVSVGSKVVVMETWPDGSIKNLWPFPEFQRLLIKETIAVGKTIKKAADVWLNAPNGRRYDRLVYCMPGSAEQCHPDDYNGWLGFTVTPAPGDWSKNRAHLQTIICNGNQDAYTWVFNWIAALVQWPGRHAMTALVLRGGQGIGKGHFAHLMLGALFHKQQYLHIIGAGMLTGRFNEHLSGKVIVFADESTWGGDVQAADKLKGMVTESTVPIERKFLPLVEEPSALHIVIASNNDWPISIPIGDRRFMVLDVADTQQQNDAYFAPLRAELKNSGLAAMLHDLLAHQVDEHALRHPLTTASKRELMILSMKPNEQWWYEKLRQGSLDLHITTDDGKSVFVEWPTEVYAEALVDDYIQFLDKHRRGERTRRSTETELGMFLAKFTPLKKQRRLPGTGETQKKRFWDLPSLEECRQHWVAMCKWSAWENDEE